MTGLSVDIRLARPGFGMAVAHEFAAGGITALFGRSGAGKSTLLRVIAGFEPKAQGMVRFGGAVWQDARRFVAPHRRGVGFVWQDTRLFGHLSVAGNLRYAARRAPDAASVVRGEDVIGALHISPLMERRPATLSGGERQRVAIARALLSGPEVLLLDEPLAALDLKARAAILPLIARLPRAFGLPVIHVTHSVGEVAQLADRMLVLSGGRVIAAGGVAECLGSADILPATGRFEAGVMLEARVIGHDPGLRMSYAALGGHVLDIPGVSLAEGETVRLRIRARDVSVAVKKPEGLSIRNILPGRVVELAADPGTAFAETLIDIGAGRIRARLTRASVADLGLCEGMEVFALIKSVSFDRRMVPPARGDG